VDSFVNGTSGVDSCQAFAPALN